MTNRKWCTIGVLSVASLAFSPALCAQANQGGEALFKRQCAGCHGPDGSGKTAMGRSFKMRDLKSEEVQEMSDAQLSAIIENGKGKMPKYGSRLNHEQIASLVTYIRSLAKKK